jgi:hypothetical protein
MARGIGASHWHQVSRIFASIARVLFVDQHLVVWSLFGSSRRKSLAHAPNNLSLRAGRAGMIAVCGVAGLIVTGYVTGPWSQLRKIAQLEQVVHRGSPGVWTCGVIVGRR